MSYPRQFNATDMCIKHDLNQEIGCGNFSAVYKGCYQPLALDCAVKIFTKAELKRIGKEMDVCMERHALSRLNHAKIVRLIFSDATPETVSIVTELCPGGELWALCRRCGIPEPRAKFYFKQILDGVSFMHRMGIVHRDLKAENVFLSGDRRVAKIGDFGSSRDMFNPAICGSGTSSVRFSGSRPSKVMEHYVGSPNFLAPEALENKENDEKSDIWSLGCMFYQILVGIPPFSAGSEYLIYLRMRANDLVFPPAGLSLSATSLIKRILKQDRTLRPSINEILQDDFFRDTPNQLPPLSLVDLAIRAYAQQDSLTLDESVIWSFEPENRVSDRLRMVLTVREWEIKARPGNGTASVDHQNLLPPDLGKDSCNNSSSED